MNILLVILLTACGFIAAILNLAVNSRFKARVTGVCACVAVVLGVLSYGFAYAWSYGLSASTVLRTLLTVCRMFGGVNDYGTVSATSLFKVVGLETLFWLAHFMAFYVTASAAITVLGQRLLRYLRIRFLRLSGVTLVYGATPETVGLVNAPRWGRGLVFVSERGGLSDAMGGVAFDDAAARGASPAFLGRVGIDGRRTLSVYCVSPDAGENLRYATALRDALTARGAMTDSTSLFLLGVPEARAIGLLSGANRPGFGSLFACDRYELTARLAMRALPPWTRVTFDADGRAENDLRVLIVGYGPMGQAMLSQLVMNGQFEGSAFSAEVLDQRMDSLSGLLKARFPALLDACDIRLVQRDARSEDFYRGLEAQSPTLIALCAGSRAENARLFRALDRFYELRDDRPGIVQCAEGSVIVEDAEYRLERIDVNAMDRLAMVLNHAYCGGPSPEADWRSCDAFSRASCRASADFCPAYLHIMGAHSPEDLEKRWPPTGALMENLARTEHLRWCAFHLAMGYRPMTREEFDDRARRFKAGENLRPGKDTRAMAHACLIPWEALDDLSARMSDAAGKPVDYKQMDRNNILAIPEIMQRDKGIRN